MALVSGGHGSLCVFFHMILHYRILVIPNFMLPSQFEELFNLFTGICKGAGALLPRLSSTFPSEKSAVWQKDLLCIQEVTEDLARSKQPGGGRQSTKELGRKRSFIRLYANTSANTGKYLNCPLK